MNTQKGLAPIAIILIVAGILVVAAGAWYLKSILTPIGPGIACTQEAKICPDGSSVGRTGPNCEFAACPGENPDGVVCIQVITPAKNLQTGECKEFPTPCDVPEGWQKVDSCQSPQVQIDVSNPQVQIDVLTWKTYKNERYGFEVTYPLTLKVLENPQGLGAMLFSVSFENPLANQETAGQKIVFNISVFNDDSQMRQAFSAINLEDKGEVMIGGYKAKKLFTPKGGAASFTEATVYMIDAKNTSLIFYGADFSGVSQADQDKILSSFKFTL